MEQGSLEWRLARCGSLGASEVHDATHKLAKGGYPAARAQLLVRLTLERFSGRPLDSFTPSPAMLAGLEREPLGPCRLQQGHGCDGSRMWPLSRTRNWTALTPALTGLVNSKV